MSEIVGQKIGRYEVKELIGEGAMAKVYRAFDPEINRSVALKVLKKDFCVDEEYLSRFLREAKAAGALSHPNIVTVFDVGEIDSSPYIMMELLEGQDLGAVLNDKHTMSVKQTLIVGLQLAKALNYAHQSGVVHRDVKPDNIVVLPDGDIKMADFGIARMSEREDAQKTQVGSVLGTPRYMSPEQALGEGVDGRSDLFAVGVIMYEMLSGVKAFDAENIGTLMTQITQKQPKPLQEMCPDIPAGLRQIIQKLLQKKPEKRFQTGADLAAALSKELEALRDQQEEQRKHKYVPLKVRWALYMGGIVSVVLLISMSVVFSIQSRALTTQAVDAGSSFAKFIAIETAVPLLSEDWITLETFIAEAASRETFAFLTVIDREGIIRGDSDISKVGEPYEAADNTELIARSDDVIASSLTLDGGEQVFSIEAPVLFQNIEVGKVILGLSQASLQEVKRITGWLMFALAFVTISSVVLMLFIFGALLAKPLKTLCQSIDSFSGGNHDTRISQTRDDEIGEVFTSFNRMAAHLQEILSGERLVEAVNAQNTPSKAAIPATTNDHTAEAEPTVNQKQEKDSDEALEMNKTVATVKHSSSEKQETSHSDEPVKPISEESKSKSSTVSASQKKGASASQKQSNVKGAGKAEADSKDTDKGGAAARTSTSAAKRASSKKQSTPATNSENAKSDKSENAVKSDVPASESSAVKSENKADKEVLAKPDEEAVSADATIIAKPLEAASDKSKSTQKSSTPSVKAKPPETQVKDRSDEMDATTIIPPERQDKNVSADATIIAPAPVAAAKKTSGQRRASRSKSASGTSRASVSRKKS